MIRTVAAFAGILFLLSCSGIRKQPVLSQLQDIQQEFQNHSGFYLYDPEKDKEIISYNADRYFTPASNTKILTLYSSMNILPDSLAGLQYTVSNDTLYFWGTGDPSLLYDQLPPSKVIEFLNSRSEVLVYAEEKMASERFGPGWSWDDYNYDYAAERTPLPLYGNRFTFRLDSTSGLLDTPQEFFKRYIWLGDTLENAAMIRDYESNRTTFYPPEHRTSETFRIPFKYSSELVARLLTDTLHRKVTPIRRERPSGSRVRTVNSIPTDSALAIMMQDSDNFIAEQLMMMNGLMLTDTLDVRTGINASMERFFNGIPDKPRWVDGSGLSRYNLFTPRSVVWLWDQLYNNFGRERLFPIIAHGGGRGTLESYYLGEKPFIYGKTGTLSNNNTLSGFLITKKGRILIFSMMHNNYPGPSTPVKRKMEQILTEIHEKY